jgi:malonate-semialdehyde dehydrogenase (acetylating)/methylmalonate-semialdehyde dehydrogenase
MGPLVTGRGQDRVSGYIDASEAAGHFGGRLTIEPDGETGGFFVGATLFDHVRTDMSIYTDVIFGPALRTGTYQQAVELMNANPYGIGTAIFTNDGGAARRFARNIEVGMVGICVPIPVPIAYYSFGGWKSSLLGDTHAYGTQGIQFFTREKVDHRLLARPSHGGINPGFP